MSSCSSSTAFLPPLRLLRRHSPHSNPRILPTGRRIVAALSDHPSRAISYINELRSKMQTLETKMEDLHAQVQPYRDVKPSSSNGRCQGVKIDVKILGADAMIRVQCHKKNHPTTMLMAALQELELEVFCASMSVVKDLMIQQASVKMSSRMYTQEQLSSGLISMIAELSSSGAR